jgi:hypothetical protein
MGWSADELRKRNFLFADKPPGRVQISQVLVPGYSAAWQAVGVTPIYGGLRSC